MGILAASDRAAGAVASAATTLGQLALLALGVHLAADQLDDRLVEAILWAQSGLDALLGPALERLAAALSTSADGWRLWERVPVVPVASSCALGVEAAARALLSASFLLTPRGPRLSWRAWRGSVSVGAVVVPIALAGVLLAGAWSMAMGAEDLLPPSALARPAAAVLGGVVAARFGLPAWRRAVAALDPDPQWHAGWRGALVLAPLGALAWAHGVPVWGLARAVGGAVWGAP